jgi:predicted kinase
MLYIFAGLPGTGKSTLSSRLAQQIGAVYLRIDTIEQAMLRSGGRLIGPEGYAVAYALAADQLRLGWRVVADSVNPLTVTRAAWRAVGMQAQVAYVEIEVICSDRDQHRRQVEMRTADIGGQKLPSWQAVITREYQAWDQAPLVIDTAGKSVEQSFAELLARLGEAK